MSWQLATAMGLTLLAGLVLAVLWAMGRALSRADVATGRLPTQADPDAEEDGEGHR